MAKQSFRRRASPRAIRYACLSPLLFRLERRLPITPFARRIRAAKAELPDASFLLRNRYRVARGQGASGERYVVCADINDVYSGLGCCLLALGPVWKYARSTGRTLVIDWRGNPYTRAEPDKNLFSLLFEPPDPSEIGVRCVADDSVGDLRLPQPILGPSNEMRQESGAIHRFPAAGACARDMRRIIGARLDVDFPTVMPSLETTFRLATDVGPMGCKWPPMFGFREGRRLYRSLKVRPRSAESIADFHRAHLSDRPVIGVHVRHGNGEGGYRDHFRNREIRGLAGFIVSVVDKIRRCAAGRFRRGYTVFLCTDSDDVVAAMRPSFDSLVTRRIWRPPPGEGVDFDHAYRRADGGEQAAADALIDMHLLAKCDIVLVTRPSAFASHVPYLMEKPGAVFLDAERTARI